MIKSLPQVADSVIISSPNMFFSSGKVIAENYSRYSLQNGDDGVRYVIAYNSVNGSTSNGNYDVFAIS